jgi:hypothetical protein
MYDAKFTSGGILFHEFMLLREIVLSDRFEELVKKEEQENKLMAVAMLKSRTTILREVKRRHAQVQPDFWVQFYHWKEQEQRLALFFLCLKSYPLLLDIHLDLTVKKFKTSGQLESYDVTMWLDEASTKDENVASWSDKTLKKVNTQYRRMLKESGLLRTTHITKPIGVSSHYFNYFVEMNEAWFLQACFIKI